MGSECLITAGGRGGNEGALFLRILTFQAKVHFKHVLLFLLFPFSLFFFFSSFFFFFCLAIYVPWATTGKPSYIKLQHKDLVRIMNPHLHRHLYSDLPGYKLGRSSGILSRSFHGKLWLLKLLSPSPPPFFLSICGGRWSLMTTCFLRNALAPPSFSVWCQFQADGGKSSSRYSSWRCINSRGQTSWETGICKQLKGVGKLIIMCGKGLIWGGYIQTIVIL